MSHNVRSTVLNGAIGIVRVLMVLNVHMVESFAFITTCRRLC